jgi:phage gp36-like protein
MPYATKQDMIDRYGQTELAQLTDRAAGTTIDDNVLNRALGDADSTINGYLAARYTLPLSSTPPLILRLACEISRYSLYEDAAPEQVEKRHDAAIKTLEGVARGLVNLGLDSTLLAQVPTAADEVQIQSTGNVFDRSDTSYI